MSLKTHRQLQPPFWLRINWENPAEPQAVNGPEITLSDDVCFCCLRNFDVVGSATREHVFPLWLFQRFPHLRKETYNFFGHIPVKLSVFKIPACGPCNNEYLSHYLENPISRACQSYETALQVDRTIWGSWAAKIFYGIYLKGNSLRADIRDTQSPPLIDKEFVFSVNRIRTLSILAASAFQLIPHGAQHSTVVLLRCKEKVPQPPVEFIDLPQLHSLAMRIGSAGMIICLGDGGLTEKVLINSSFYEDYNRKPLTAFRFGEAAAIVSYQRSRLTWMPEPVFLEISESKIACVINTTTLSLSPLQSDFDPAEARKMFASVFQVPIDNIVYNKKQGIVVNLPIDHPLAECALDD